MSDVPPDPAAGVQLLWTPHAKGRPRINTKTGNAYTPKATREAERDLRRQWPDDVPPAAGPCAVLLDFTNDWVGVRILPRAIPIASGRMRGDLDNYVKLVLDALNGRAWVDDRLIVALTARRR